MLLRRDLLFAFQDFASSLADSCNISSKVVSTPIRVSNHYNPMILFYAFVLKNNIFASIV